MAIMLLDSNEQILRRERLHGAVFAFPVLVMLGLLACSIPGLFLITKFGQAFGAGQAPMVLMALVPDIVLGLSVLLVTLFAYFNSEVTLTNKRLMFRTGFIVRAAGELPLENIEGILILDPLLGRLFGYGTIMVTTLGGARYRLDYIPSPEILHTLLQRTLGAAKDALRSGSKSGPAPQYDSRYMPKAGLTRPESLKASEGANQPPPQLAQRLSPEVNHLKNPASANHSILAVMAISIAIGLVAFFALLLVFLRPVTSPATALSGPSTPSEQMNSLERSSELPSAVTSPLHQSNPPLAEIKAAAEQGDAAAQDKLGDFCRSDPEKAVVWYRKAAAQGVVNSQYQLAHLLMSWANSPTVTRQARALSFDEALPWLIKTANRGMQPAQIDLGAVYRDGKHVTKDLPEAYKWFCLASAATLPPFVSVPGRTDLKFANREQDQLFECDAGVKKAGRFLHWLALFQVLDYDSSIWSFIL